LTSRGTGEQQFENWQRAVLRMHVGEW
jgi:hypothetical protein